MATSETASDFFTRKEAAEYLRGSVQWIDLCIQAGVLHAQHAGRRVLLSKEEVKLKLKTNSLTPLPSPDTPAKRAERARRRK